MIYIVIYGKSCIIYLKDNYLIVRHKKEWLEC